MSGMVEGGPLAPLERYLDATAIPPPPDLAERIGARLLFEPPSTAPRRFLAALRALDLRGVLRGLGQNAATAFRPGTRSMLLRAQAMAVVLVTMASVGFGGVAGLAATRQAIDELQAWSARTIPSPASPAAQVAPSVQQSEVGEPVDRAGDPGRPDELARGRAPARDCPNPADPAIEGFDGPKPGHCPSGAEPGSPSGDDRPGKGVDMRRPDPPGERGGADKAADPSVGKAAINGDKGQAVPRPERKADRGDDARDGARSRAPQDREPQSGKPPKKARTSERDRRP